MKSLLQLENKDNRLSIVQVHTLDNQVRVELYPPDARTVHVVVDGTEDWGIVHEILAEHQWEIWTVSGKRLPFSEMVDRQIDGEFLNGDWCCPDCRLILKPSGAIEVLHGSKLERYHCVNPTCSNQQQSVDFTPDIEGSQELLGSRQLAVRLAVKCD